jgi:hypothetical protein
VFQNNSSGICTNSSTTSYYISQGSGASLTANQLVVGNKIWDDDLGGNEESSIGYYKFPKDGYNYHTLFAGSSGSRIVQSVTQC